jgi:hypothetical protein
MLTNSDRIKVKEASCRKIIKLFAEKKKESGHSDKSAHGITPGGPKTLGETPGAPLGGPKADENSKIEFINLVEPLIRTMKNANFNLASLAASALVNLCNYSDDIKDIFIQK